MKEQKEHCKNKTRLDDFRPIRENKNKVIKKKDKI